MRATAFYTFRAPIVSDCDIMRVFWQGREPLPSIAVAQIWQESVPLDQLLHTKYCFKMVFGRKCLLENTWPERSFQEDFIGTEKKSIAMKGPVVVIAAFSSLARSLGECSTIHLLACAFFFVEISSRRLIPLFTSGSVHSGSASWDDCDPVFPDELRVSLFPDRLFHYAWTAA